MHKFLTIASLSVGVAFLPHAAAAQSGVEVRVDRLEGQMRAVQRKVFPTVNGRLVQPEITGIDAVADIGTPSGTAVSDLTARVDALESQQRALTAQIEQNQFDLRQLKEGFAAYKRTTDAQLQAMKDSTTSPGGAAPRGAIDEPTSVDRAGPRPGGTATPRSTPAPATTTSARPAATTTATSPAVTSRDPARAKLVAAVEKPATDDAGEDAYNYGYRLWEAKYYPEAETQFRSVAKTYPEHRRVSRAQNMLGRALLDDGKPNLAVLAFYDNYRSNPKGDRAHESLYYLAQALTVLKKPASEICKVYDELTDVYPDKLSDAMKTGVARGRTAQKCTK